MKQLLITIAALVLVGCGPSVPDISIHEAAGGGNIAAVKQHLAAGTDINLKGQSVEQTPLHAAAANERKEVTELLIAKGAEVNAKALRGDTPLHNAVGDIEVAEILIAKGAAVNAMDGSGKTPLDWAIRSNKKSTANFLRKHGAKTAEELKAEDK